MDYRILRDAALAGRIRTQVEYSQAEVLAALSIYLGDAVRVESMKAGLKAIDGCLSLEGGEVRVVRRGRTRSYTFHGLPEAIPTHLDIHRGDNLEVLQALPDASHHLVYIDPPFNTGHAQAHTRVRTVRDQQGDRTGFAGQRYRTERVHSTQYEDQFDDFLGFLTPRIQQAHRILTEDGAFFFHIDYREAHYCKVLIDTIFGRQSFMNEIVWAYDYGARSKSRWSAKHDVIFWYAKNPKRYTFNHEAMDRVPYMAPGLVGAEKAARGKTPTDVWWHTIVPTAGKERTGYPTQKPLGILRRILLVHTNPGDAVLDFFAGSGTTGVAACELGRSATLVDKGTPALEVMAKRLAPYNPVFHGWDPK